MIIARDLIVFIYIIVIDTEIFSLAFLSLKLSSSNMDTFLILLQILIEGG